MRSGLGPAEHLIEMGIGVRVDLPGVGAHLADHPLWSLRYATPRPETTTPAPVFQALLTLRTPLADSGRPFDAQIFPTSAARCGILQSSTGALFTLCLSIMKPRSRGRVRLSSAHPTAPPRIRFDHLAEKEDLAALCAVIAEARRLASTPPLAARAIQELYPGPRVTSSEELGLAVREGVGTYHHACGTCRMGPDSDAWAVVSGAGEVRGVSGLSVVDASILPTLPSANIHLPTLMVAERCSELARARLG
jgi:choline dehydrogenase